MPGAAPARGWHPTSETFRSLRPENTVTRSEVELGRVDRPREPGSPKERCGPP